MGFYALAHSKQASKYVSQMVALSPCFIGSFDGLVSDLDENIYRLLASVFSIFDIHSVLGPDWPEQLGEVCYLRGDDSDECKFLSDIEVGPSAQGDSIFGYREVGIKHAFHMMQNTIMGRFQEYSNYFYLGSIFTKQDLVPLESIEGVPIRFMYMLNDEVCFRELA